MLLSLHLPKTYFNVIVLEVNKHFMKSNMFWLSPEEFIGEPYTPAPTKRSETPQPLPKTDEQKKAPWFPNILHTIPVGRLNLFQVVAGTPSEIGPNQARLKEWILEQAHKHEPLKFPILLEIDENISKEELAGKIMDHLLHGSSDMIFLPTFPVNPHIRKTHKKQPLSRAVTAPISFPR